MPENRIIGNYLARRNTVTSQLTGKVWEDAPIPMISLSITPDRIEWLYGVFASDDSFNNWFKPSSDFRLGYVLAGEELTVFKTANDELLNELNNRFRPICLPQASENAELDYANFNITTWDLFLKFKGNDVPQRELHNSEYNAVIAENMDMIGFNRDAEGNILSLGLIPILDAIAAQKEPDFWEGSQYIFPE